MKHFACGIIVAGLFASTVVAAQTEDGKSSAQGRVVDANGNPVANADVSTYWTFLKGNPSFNRRNRTDEDGVFEIEIYPRSGPITLFAMDRERENAAIVNLRTETLGEGVIAGITLRLAPVITVRGQLVCTELEETCGNLSLSFSGKGGSHFAFFPADGDGRFAVKLPPGDYRWSVFGGLDFVSLATRDLEIPMAQEDVELGRIDMEVSVIRKHIGAESPAWTIREARGLSANAQISDLKGKWILIEFWQYT